MILDTNAVSAWWLGTPSLLTIIGQADALHLAAPVLAEFHFGILKSARRNKMEGWFTKAKSLATLLPADDETAEVYAHTRLQLESLGRKIPMNDLWIAAIALQHDLPVISNDTHFDAIPDLHRIPF